MSYTKAGFPATFAAEGNPVAGGFPGEFDPYVHTAKDTMVIEDEDVGVFSIEVSFNVPWSSHNRVSTDVCFFDWQHMARFSELAIAFAVEQAGWDNAWR